MLSRSKDILILGLNFDQLNFIKVIKKMGYNIFGVDQNQNAPGVKYCNFYYKCSYTEVDKILKFINKNNFSKNGNFFTAASQVAYLSLAKIAKKNKSKFIDPVIVDKCINKKTMNDLFLKNNISIPNTVYIYNNKTKLNKNKTYFLKSDYGKTPKYCYKIKNGILPGFPKKDDFYKKCFLLQDEIIGEHYRLNLIDGNFIVFYKLNEKLFKLVRKTKYSFPKIKKTLDTFVKRLKLDKLIIKFDIIVNKDNWYAIDIGFDPPKRLESVMNFDNRDFFKAYVYYWFNQQNLFKKLKFNNLENLFIKMLKNGKTKVYR